MRILIFNAGSSSIKYKLIKLAPEYRVEFSGLIEAIGESNSSWRHEGERQALPITDHRHAMELLSEQLSHQLDAPLDAVGHRVVHGSQYFSRPTQINDAVVQRLLELEPLAPLHNPVNVACILAARKLFPSIPHIALFDTAFHQTMPEKAYRYALDKELADEYSIRRYGFHGTNHEYVAKRAADFLNKPLSACNFISLHLGNGCSACLIKQGKSFDTSMGMTPLAGLVMGTRCGDIDPSISHYLIRQGFSQEKVENLLNHRSGLKGVAGVNDMRLIETRAEEGDENAQLALAIFCYRIQHYLGAYYSQTPRLDGVIFTGGIGENSVKVRHNVMDNLRHMGLEIDAEKNRESMQEDVSDIASGNTPILVIKGDEEKHMANLILELLA